MSFSIVARSGDFIVTYWLVLFGSTISLEFPFNQPHLSSLFLSFFHLFLSSPVCVVGVTLALSPTVWCLSTMEPAFSTKKLTIERKKLYLFYNLRTNRNICILLVLYFLWLFTSTFMMNDYMSLCVQILITSQVLNWGHFLLYILFIMYMSSDTTP